MDNKEKELDILFGEQTDGRAALQELKEMSDPNNEQISTHSMNNKTVIETVKEKIEELKEWNSEEKPELISEKNSENALPDELSQEDGVPISTEVTEGIHHADETENEELISSHNSERILENTSVTNTEEINVISTINSSKFVPEE